MSLLFKLVNEGFKLCLDGETAFEVEREPALTRVFGQRGGRVCFQALLRSEEAAIWNLGQEPWFSQQGPLLHLRLELRAPYPLRAWHEQLHLDDDGNLRADALLPHPVRELRAKETAAAFFELELPEDAGLDEGQGIELRLYASRLTGEERLVERLELPLTVYAARQLAPEERSIYLDLWQHPCNIARKHEAALWSQEHFEAMEGYAKALAALGQRSITVLLSDAPWRGQSCMQNQRNPSNLFEYSMTRIFRGKDGSLRFDFSIVDRVIELFERCGVQGEIECFGLVNIWPNQIFDPKPLVEGDVEPQISLRCLNESSGSYEYLHDTQEVEEYFRAVERHFVQTGRVERVRVAADEPADPERFERAVERLRRCAPRLRLRTAINHADFIGRFGQQIDEFVPNLESSCKEYERLKAYQKAMPDKRFLWYVCCGPDHPNTFLRSNLLEARLIGPLSYLLGFDGFLRWNFTVWPEDPRLDIRYGNFAAGDTNFVYPGRGREPLLSLRYKALQRGLEDHGLLCQAPKEAAEQALGLIFRKRDPRDFLQDRAGELLDLQQICSTAYADFERARELLLQAVAN